LVKIAQAAGIPCNGTSSKPTEKLRNRRRADAKRVSACCPVHTRCQYTPVAASRWRTLATRTNIAAVACCRPSSAASLLIKRSPPHKTAGDIIRRLNRPDRHEEAPHSARESFPKAGPRPLRVVEVAVAHWAAAHGTTTASVARMSDAAGAASGTPPPIHNGRPTPFPQPAMPPLPAAAPPSLSPCAIVGPLPPRCLSPARGSPCQNLARNVDK